MTTQPANPDLPRIWYTRYLSSTQCFVDLDHSLRYPNNAIPYLNKLKAWEKAEQNEAPEFIFFDGETRQIRKSSQDAFKIVGDFPVISPKLRDVLVRFDLGATDLFEVPIYMDQGRTPSPYPPHYLLHVAETKPTLIVEKSSGIEQFIPGPGNPWWVTYGEEILTVRASSASGADLWADQNLSERLFFSDRLKQAIEAARIKSRGLTFVETTVIA